VELAETLRGQNFAVPIIFLTGSHDEINFEENGQNVVRKPFTRAEILSVLKRVLTAGTGRATTSK
jgi:CheY-like chemotaxis protein